MAAGMKMVLYVTCLWAVIISAPYLTETAEDIMECWSNNAGSPSSDAACTKTVMKNSKYKCCYVEKTERTDKKATIKTCVRLYNDEPTLRDYQDRLRDDFKDIKILCSAQGLLTMSLLSTILILMF